MRLLEFASLLLTIFTNNKPIAKLGNIRKSKITACLTACYSLYVTNTMASPQPFFLTKSVSKLLFRYI